MDQTPNKQRAGLPPYVIWAMIIGAFIEIGYVAYLVIRQYFFT